MPGDRRQTDLAVLRGHDHSPLGLLELKAAYTFDFVGEPTIREYEGLIAEDLRKAAVAGAGRAPVFALLLLTHPSDVPQGPPEVVKYPDRIRSSLKKRSAEELAADARATAIARLGHLGVVEHGVIDAGSAFGVDVSLYYFFVPPEELRD